MRFGSRQPCGTSATSGYATQKTSVAAIGFAPRPVPMMSRMQPPMPVAAPPYGSIALGRLWVSHLKHTAWSSSNATTPELSTNTERHQSMPSAMSSWVLAATVDLSRLRTRTVPSADTSWFGRPFASPASDHCPSNAGSDDSSR